MKKSSLFLLSSAFVLAVGVALLARALLAPSSQPVVVEVPQEVVKPEPKPMRSVVVLRRKLLPGELIKKTHLGWKEVDATDVDGGNRYILRGQESSIYGATVRRDVGAGDVLEIEDVVRQGDPGFLAAVLTPGMRAVSIPTSRVESNFGFASPGDRVDVILGLKRQDMPASLEDGSTNQPQLASQTILRDVRVLALNDQTFDDPQHDGSKKKKRSNFETVTLEVQPFDAERLVVAKEVGTMQLALRSARELKSERVVLEVEAAQPIEKERKVTTLKSTTTLYSALQSKTSGSAPIGIQVFKGNSVEMVSFSSQ